MHRLVHIPPRTWHPAPRFPRSWSFCRWLGHGLPLAHRSIIDRLEAQRLRHGLVRAYVADPDPSVPALLAAYVNWMRQCVITAIDPRVVVVGRSAVAARSAAAMVPGSRPVSATLADNLRGCAFEMVLMIDTHAYCRQGALDTARRALVGPVMPIPGTVVIFHSVSRIRSVTSPGSPFVTSGAYIGITPHAACGSGGDAAIGKPRAPVPSGSGSPLVVRFSPIQSEKSHRPRRQPPPALPRLLPVIAVAATAPHPGYFRNPSSKELIDILCRSRIFPNFAQF